VCITHVQESQDIPLNSNCQHISSLFSGRYLFNFETQHHSSGLLYLEISYKETICIPFGRANQEMCFGTILLLCLTRTCEGKDIFFEKHILPLISF
jgi:hypothetical protein